MSFDPWLQSTAPVTHVSVGLAVPRAEPAAKGTGRPVVTPVSALHNGSALSRGTSSSGLRPHGGIACVVRVRDADGVTGAGSGGLGHPAMLPVVEHLAPLVLGRSPLELNARWEEMFRNTINIGRRGIVLHALSAIDIALWDLAGRRLGQPVINLLGGAVRDRQPAYASWLYATEDLEALAREAAGWVEQGFTAVKQRLAYGPGDGKAGIRRNVELVRTVADAIGPDVDHMADAYMGWDSGYAIRMIRAIEDAGIRLRWLEEPTMPDDLSGMARIRQAVDTPIASGEHEATRYGFREMIERGAVDVLQPDACRLGGITEARRVWALGETFGLDVVAHLGFAANLHLSAASVASPFVEYMPPPRSGEPDEDQIYRSLFPDEPLAVDGCVPVPARPGLGVELDESRLEHTRVFEAPDTRARSRATVPADLAGI